MKRIFAMLFVACAFVGFSCSEDDTPDVSGGTEISEEAMARVIATYVDRVVLPTYALMETNVKALNDAVVKFIESGTEADLQAACDAWRAARKPWEESEAFLFGPADYENLDPSLDSWPLQKDDIDQILATNDFSEIDGDSEEAQGVRGFHTLEYLLFDEGKAKNPANMSDNEKEYMRRVSARLLNDTETLHKAWKEGLNSEEVPIAFGEELKLHTSGRTSSAQVVIGDFIIDGGIINISDEVGEQKIGNPYEYWKSKDYETAVLEVESWYSWNSLTDYEDNIISIENAYMGGRVGNRDDATSLSALVRSVDKDLDTRVKDQIAATRKSIRDIPAPFRKNVASAEAGNAAKGDIEAAMNACSELSDIFREVINTLGLN